MSDRDSGGNSFHQCGGRTDMEPRAPSTCKMRVASEKGGVESKNGAGSNRKCSRNG